MFQDWQRVEPSDLEFQNPEPERQKSEPERTGSTEPEMSTEDFLKAIHQVDKLVILFKASWCGACRSIVPIYEELSEKPEYSNISFIELDVDESPTIFSVFEVEAFPTFFVFDHGVQKKMMRGANKELLVEALDSLLSWFVVFGGGLYSNKFSKKNKKNKLSLYSIDQLF